MKILTPLIQNNLLVPGAQVKKDPSGRPTGVPFLPPSYGMRWREEARAGLSQEEREADSEDDEDEEEEDLGEGFQGEEDAGMGEQQEEGAKEQNQEQGQEGVQSSWEQNQVRSLLGLDASASNLAGTTDTEEQKPHQSASSSASSSQSRKPARASPTSPTKPSSSQFRKKQTSSRGDQGLWNTAGRRQKN